VFATISLIGAAEAKPVAPTGVDSVDFAAAGHETYDHSTGGGKYGDGSNTFVREELESTDFACGDIVSYFLKFEGNGSGTAVTTEWKIDFDYSPTGQDGVALVPLTGAAHLLLNTTDDLYADAGTTAGLQFISTALLKESPAKPVQKFVTGYTQLTFRVSGVDPGDVLIVRMDARIDCQAGSSPTGNLLTKVDSGSIGSDSINVGSQTIPLKVKAGFIPETGTPALSVVKTVTTAGGDCATATHSLVLAADPPTVKYCYSVTNSGTEAAFDVTLVDDNATPGNTADDVTLVLTPLAELGGGNGRDLAAGATATASQAVELAGEGTFTNIAVAMATDSEQNDYEASDEATVTVEFGLEITKSTVGAGPFLLGDTITYSIVATNFTELITYTNVVITDDNAVLGACTPELPTSLAPGQSVTCSATHVVTEADIAAGIVDNVAAVDADENGDPIESRTSNIVRVQVGSEAPGGEIAPTGGEATALALFAGLMLLTGWGLVTAARRRHLS